MKNQSSQKKIHIDNLYLMKKLDEDYHKEFMRFYDYVLHSNTSDADINIIVNTALEQCLEGMKKQKESNAGNSQGSERIYDKAIPWQCI